MLTHFVPKLLLDLIHEDPPIHSGLQAQFCDTPVQAVEADVEHTFQLDQGVEKSQLVKPFFLPNPHELVTWHQKVSSELVCFTLVPLAI